MLFQNEKIDTSYTRKVIYLVVLWSLIVLPCCWFGYGSDEDAWAMGEEGALIWNTGAYSVSRSTGFPLQELAIAFFSHYGGWLGSNLFSFLCGLVLAYFLFLLIKKKHFKNPLWVFVGVLFLPQILINSASSIDYMPSLALFLAAYYFFTIKKLSVAALMIGISCGFRPSNGAFILPIIFAQFSEDYNYKLALKVFLIAFISGILSFSPALINYGLLSPSREVDVPFFKYYTIGGYQALILFGIAQSIVLGGLFVYYFVRIKTAFTASTFVRFHILNIGSWLLFFIFVTCSESEYLFPILFSVIFLADAVFESRHLKILVAVLLSYNFFSLEMLGGESGERTVTARMEWGYTIRDMQDRLFKQWYREATTAFKCDRKILLMYGLGYVKANNEAWEYSTIGPRIIKQKDGNLYLSERILDEALLKKLKGEGFQIYVYNKRKWEYITLKLDFWTKYVNVVYNLEYFLGSKKYGKMIQ